MANPLVSVVIPAYNCERFIEESVRSALNQTVGDLEIIVIDDASSDRTYDILRSLVVRDKRIHLLQNELNLGVAGTRNLAFDMANGQYIAFLDADDVWIPSKLEKQLAFMERTNCDFCYTSYYSFIDKDGTSIEKPYVVPNVVDLKKLIYENVIGCSTVLCKSELLKAHRMRAEYAHEDYVLWLELLQSGYQAAGIAEPLMRYRVLLGSRSRNKTQAAQNRWKVYRNLLDLSIAESLKALMYYAFNALKKRI